MSGGDEEIVFGRAGGLATILINRPQALNALTLDNYRRLVPVLEGWADDPSVHAVVIRGAGGRAFCAGGDVHALYRAGRTDPPDYAFWATFFREEYALMQQIHRFPKPYIAVIDGITMGGGAGMSINGAYRVANERTLFAMPETAIGLFPDVGATRFLNRCPGHVGRYLGLTGARLGMADCCYCGFATHVVAQERVEALLEKLSAVAWDSGGETRQVESVLDEFAIDPGPPPLAGLRPAIDRCFGFESVEAIVAALLREKGEPAGWAAKTQRILSEKSPTSLKITLRQLSLGAGLTLEESLALEYRMTQRVMTGHDFYEGVRAMLIDKDKTPRWRPASLGEIDEQMVAAYFASLGDRELRFQ